MAFVARQGVIDEHDKWSDNKLVGHLRKSDDRPATTSTLVVGNTAYITSSMKSRKEGPYLYLPEVPMTTLDTGHCKEPLRAALANCQAKRFETTESEEGHANKGVSLSIHR
jgi:hypothetical protein